MLKRREALIEHKNVTRQTAPEINRPRIRAESQASGCLPHDTHKMKSASPAIRRKVPTKSVVFNSV